MAFSGRDCGKSPGGQPLATTAKTKRKAFRRNPGRDDSELPTMVRHTHSALPGHSRSARQTKASTGFLEAFDEYKKGKTAA